jgi:hypothetical protein
MVGCGSKHIYRAYNNTVDALERAIKERMLFYKEEGEYWPMIRPNPDAFSNRAAKFKSAIKKLSVWTLPTEMVPFAESFSGQKRLRYLKAAENLSRQGFRKEWTKVKMFLKFETNFHPGSATLSIPEQVEASAMTPSLLRADLSHPGGHNETRLG